jgi:hypothetical protein
MFDLTGSSDDGEDLEENMKEIKQMIDKEKKKKSPSSGNEHRQDSADPPENTSQKFPSTDQQTQSQQKPSRGLDNRAGKTPESTQTKEPSPQKEPQREQSSAAGPLFIRQSKFDDASRMIGQMRQLSREMQKVTEQLSQGIEQDAQTERRARELLGELDEGRNNVQEIVSPEE